MQPICYIVGALASALPFTVRPVDLLLAADAGINAVQQAGMTPNLIVGDFDSLGYVPCGDNIIRHPVQKDDTDTLLAARLGLERGFREFHIYGGTGGRTDHTIANIQTLAFLLEHGATGYLCGQVETFTLVENGALRFPAGCEGLLSVFAYGGDAAGVTLTGLAYSLDGALLTPAFPIGVSNAFTGTSAEVRVARGRLLVIWTTQPALPERG